VCVTLGWLCKGKHTWYNVISIHAIIIQSVFYSLSWRANLTGHSALLFLTSYLTTSETSSCCYCFLVQIFIRNHFHDAAAKSRWIYYYFHCYYYCHTRECTFPNLYWDKMHRDQTRENLLLSIYYTLQIRNSTYLISTKKY